MTLLLIVALPLAGWLLIAIAGSRFARLCGPIAAGSLALAFGAALAVGQAFIAGKTSLVAEIAPWIPIRGGDIALRVDPATLPLALVTTTVATLVALFAIGAVPRAEAQRFFGALELASFGALLAVTASGLALVVAGWWLTSLSVYLLAGAQRERPAAAAAAMTTFVVGRIGDAALLLAVAATFSAFRTIDLSDIAARLAAAADQPDLSARLEEARLLPSALLLVAALARAAQLPILVRRPRAWTRPALAALLLLAAIAMTSPLLILRLGPALQPAAVVGAVGVAIVAVVLVGAGLSGRVALGRLFDRSIVRLLDVLGGVLETGSERVIARIGDGVGGGAAALGALLLRRHGQRARTYEALLLAGAIVLAAYWSLR